MADETWQYVVTVDQEPDGSYKAENAELGISVWAPTSDEAVKKMSQAIADHLAEPHAAAG